MPTSDTVEVQGTLHATADGSVFEPPIEPATSLWVAAEDRNCEVQLDVEISTRTQPQIR
jgi:hypothetical protein